MIGFWLQLIVVGLVVWFSAQKLWFGTTSMTARALLALLAAAIVGYLHAG